MEIYLKNEDKKSDKFRFPVIPSSIEIEDSAILNSSNITNMGDIVLYGGKGLRKTQISSFFPNKKRDYPFVNYSDYPKPYECVKKIKDWMDKGQVLRFIVTDTEINFKVIISSFKYSEKDGSRDVYFTLELNEYRKVTISEYKKTAKIKDNSKETPLEIILNDVQDSDKSDENTETKVKCKITAKYKNNAKDNTCIAPSDISSNSKIKITGTDVKKVDDKTYTVVDKDKSLKHTDSLCEIIILMKTKKEADNFGTKYGYVTIQDTTKKTPTASGATVPEKIWNFARGKGASEGFAAGLIGNAYRECSFIPSCVKGRYHGLFQWGYPNGLLKYAKQKGKSWTDVQIQMEWLWKCMDGTSKDEYTYTASKIKKAYGSLEKFITIKDPGTAAREFNRLFEVSGDPKEYIRVKKAKEYYNKFKGK